VLDWPIIAIVAAVFAPFVVALLAPLLVRVFGAATGWLLALVPGFAAYALIRLLPEIGGLSTILVTMPWVPSWQIELSFLIDGLSLMFSLTIAVVGTFILLYADRYLADHPHRGRFLAYMLAFMGAMQGLVLSDNLIALYLFWELTSVTSFLLIGFDHQRQAARRAAIQALVVTGFGGLALLGAGIAIHAVSGWWELSALIDDLRLTGVYPLVVLLVLLAAFTKSAQLPFHFWLPNAMEAPTPVSAYLHSATMVQAGVYLVARMSPHLGGEAIWNGTLMLFGGATLLWGAVAALRQTDLKQMLAQSTLASLGLLMLLLGIGTELALMGMALYFVAHALYKAALFLIAGAIDHGTGTRDITALGGLRGKLPLTFGATILASLAMVGLPPFVAFYAKEEMYAALVGGDFASLVALAVLVIGNALLAAIGLVMLIRPFMGPLLPTPLKPHEAPVAMLVGPLVFGVVGIALGVLPGWTGFELAAPAASAMAGETITSHLGEHFEIFGLVFGLSVLTWALAVVTYLSFDKLRTWLARAAASGFSFDAGFDRFYFGLVAVAAALTRLFHHGRLEFYLLVVFLLLAVATIVPLWTLGTLPPLPPFPDLRFYEWGVVGLAVLGLVTVVLARSRLFAILALGIQGLALAMLFMLFGAPDLSFTQFMVEILSVVILALVMTRLQLDATDPRPLEDWLRDGAVAAMGGFAVTTLLFSVLDRPLDLRLSQFFEANSAPVAHGHNIVNVILVDFRGVDTLGEISVVMAAGIAILALIRGARKAKGAGQGPVAPASTPAPKDAAGAARKPRARKVAT
jgi:multicomponent Na+:H+ antiporter subunit A